MTKLIKNLARTKLSGSATKKTFAKKILSDLEKHPERIAEYRFLAVLMDIEETLDPGGKKYL